MLAHTCSNVTRYESMWFLSVCRFAESIPFLLHTPLARNPRNRKEKAFNLHPKVCYPVGWSILELNLKVCVTKVLGTSAGRLMQRQEGYMVFKSCYGRKTLE